MRGTPNEVAQREIRIRQQACNKNDCALCGLDHAVDLFQSSAKGKVVIVTNSKKKSFVFVDSLEKKTDEANLPVPVDVLHIHESLLNTENFWHIWLFCHPTANDELDTNIHVLVGTNAVNVGIDDDLIELVISLVFPCDLPTVFQEQGHGSRQIGSAFTTIVMYCLRYFDYLMREYPIATSAAVDIELTSDQLQFIATTSHLSPVSESGRQKLRKRTAAPSNPT